MIMKPYLCKKNSILNSKTEGGYPFTLKHGNDLHGYKFSKSNVHELVEKGTPLFTAVRRKSVQCKGPLLNHSHSLYAVFFIDREMFKRHWSLKS
jgi:hypothetical protein